MTDTGELSDSEKTIIMNPDEPIFGDLITEIELEVNVEKPKESLTDLDVVVEEHNIPAAEQPTDIPTESTYASADVLTQDDAVSDFFSKTEEFENDMLIGDIDTEGIDFKNETDVAECHHEYESKKLLFGDCEDIVEVVNVVEVPQEEEVVVTAVVEEVVVTAVVEDAETVVEVIIEDNAIPVVEDIEVIVEEEKVVDNTEAVDPFEINTEESLNRMHVMEDVEEGCDVSGALPSSPGHAEQRPDPPKTTPESITPIETITTTEVIEPDTSIPPQPTTPPTENGFTSDDPGKTMDDTPITEVTENCEPKSPEKETVQDDEIKDIKEEIDEERKPKEKLQNEEDSSSDSSSNQSNNNKRKLDEDDSSSTPAKKLRSQIQQQFINHDRILNDYIESSGCGTIDELQSHAEQILAEIRTLNELAREKEREWNQILHVKKVKEELLLRMQRKKQILLMSSGNGDKNETSDWEEQEMLLGKDGNATKQAVIGGNGNLMMVPVVSSSPAGSRSGNSTRHEKKHRTILPKTTNVLMNDLNGQECKQGRQGPILDVRSIIADYRQRHPETVPRRGRRLKSVLNSSHHNDKNNVLSMASLAFGAGAQVRHGTASDMSNELGMLLSAMDQVRQDGSRPSSADSSVTSGLGANETAMSFKDVLVQFARLSQNERQELQAHAAASLTTTAISKPPPPPYPEVTLHPVPPATTTPVQPPAPQNNSLLHGILTKTQPTRTEPKPTTFSPTLARLLTAPERVSTNNAQAMYTAALNSGVSISDLLQTGKSRTEITITPVHQFGQNMKSSTKVSANVEEEEAEDSADRLVIDEGTEINANDRSRTDNGSEAGDEVPQCQGCHQKSAQFVCAGCGNQWYCSRDCQVAAWDEHSEVCSG